MVYNQISFGCASGSAVGRASGGAGSAGGASGGANFSLAINHILFWPAVFIKLFQRHIVVFYLNFLHR